MLDCSPPGTPAEFRFPSPVRSGIEQWMDRITGDFDAQAAREELVRLLHAVSGGDRGAFARLYERTSAKLYGICLRLIGNEVEAQDVLQDTYVTIWRKADQFDSRKASPITWLAVVARNKTLDRLRSRVAVGEELSAAAAIEDDSPSAFSIVAAKDDSTRLHQCLETLDSRARALIRAAFLDGASYPQLAEREGVPIGTMKSWIRRGLQRLRGCLDQ